MAEVKYDKLTIYEVEEFYEYLLQMLKDNKSKLELDFKNIQKIDMVAIQLLISLQQTCKKDSIDLELRNFSEPLMEILKSSGCEGILGVIND